jgi:hypothetical protein
VVPGPDLSEVKRRNDVLERNEIRTFTLGKTAEEVLSVERLDGTTLYPATAPAVWEWLGVFAMPALGFLLPWGAIRVLSWVAQGFCSS